MNEILKEISRLQLVIGGQCNVRCAMCYQRTYDAVDNRFPRIYKEYLLPLYPYLSRLIIVGGEPTIMPHCRELVKFVGRFPNIRFEICTNGVCVDDFWMGIFREKSDLIRVSINAATRNTYDRIMKHGDFNKVTGHVRRMTRERANEKLLVLISTVLLRHNAHEIAEFVELGHELGVDKVMFSVDPVLSFYKLPAKIVRKELDKALRVIERTGMAVTGLNVIAKHVNHPWGERSLNGQAKKCQSPFRLLLVDPSGDVRICSHAWVVLGNIYRSSLDEILGSRCRKRLQEKIDSGDHSWCPPYCPNNSAPAKMAQFNRYFYLLCRNPGELLMDAMHRLDRRRHL
jgi:MoaA/NifB/PqqE/SkfB family radical SAM enzyme